MCMSSPSMPSPPPPPAPPKPAALPWEETLAGKAELKRKEEERLSRIEAEKKAEEEAARVKAEAEEKKRRGRKSTILTGNLGVEEEASIKKKTLLGQ